MPVALALLSILGAFPDCGESPHRSARAALHLAINLERVSAGLRPLSGDPTLCSVAAKRARSVAASGSPDVDLRLLNETRRELWRRGYRPHNWVQSSLILNPGDWPLASWQEVKPEAFRDSVRGDFEHVGVGFATHEGRPVYSIVLGLTKLTFEWRQAEPLRDLEQVRSEMLARVNSIRTAHGRPPLEAEGRLDLAAHRHARDLFSQGYYSHRSLDGRSLRDRVVATGFSGRPALSENLAKGLFSPAEVVDRWMNSSGHRKNILNARFNRMGSGVAFGETSKGVEVVWVQVFAGPG